MRRVSWCPGTKEIYLSIGAPLVNKGEDGRDSQITNCCIRGGNYRSAHIKLAYYYFCIRTVEKQTSNYHFLPQRSFSSSCPFLPSSSWSSLGGIPPAKRSLIKSLLEKIGSLFPIQRRLWDSLIFVILSYLAHCQICTSNSGKRESSKLASVCSKEQKTADIQLIAKYKPSWRSSKLFFPSCDLSLHLFALFKRLTSAQIGAFSNHLAFNDSSGFN